MGVFFVPCWIKRCTTMEAEDFINTVKVSCEGAHHLLAHWWKSKELNQGDVRGRHGGMVSERVWKDLVCPERMHSLRWNGEGKFSGHPANPSSPGRWPLNWSVCVCVFVCLHVVAIPGSTCSINAIVLQQNKQLLVRHTTSSILYVVMRWSFVHLFCFSLLYSCILTDAFKVIGYCPRL